MTHHAKVFIAPTACYVLTYVSFKDGNWLRIHMPHARARSQNLVPESAPAIRHGQETMPAPAIGHTRVPVKYFSHRYITTHFITVCRRVHESKITNSNPRISRLSAVKF